MNAARRKPENHETNAARQARLRERRKELGFRRVTVWLSPEQVDRMERQGGELWLGTTVKQLLESAVAEPPRPPASPVARFVVPDPQTDNAPMESGQPTDKAALFQGVEQLRQQGASWRGIARQWNAQGRRTATGAVYSNPIQVVEIPLLGKGGVARSAGVVRNGDSTNQIGAL